MCFPIQILMLKYFPDKRNIFCTILICTDIMLVYQPRQRFNASVKPDWIEICFLNQVAWSQILFLFNVFSWNPLSKIVLFQECSFSQLFKLKSCTTGYSLWGFVMYRWVIYLWNFWALLLLQYWCSSPLLLLI